MRLRISKSNSRERSRFQATSRLLCWLRPSWHCTTMPVGMCVRRTAESVLLMCCPPAPDALNVSVRTSDGLMSISIESSTSGYTNRLAKLVWRPPDESNGLLRTSRCTPVSVRRWPKA